MGSFCVEKHGRAGGGHASKLCAGVPSIVRTGLTTGLREPDEFKASEESRAKESQIKYRDTIRESHKSRVLMVVEGETGGGRERESGGIQFKTIWTFQRLCLF